MTDIILFDLDGTLLPMGQDNFVKTYFGELVKKIAPLGYDKDEIVKAIWAGTDAMIANDGKVSNERCFWDKFVSLLGDRAWELEPYLDDFYRNEFNNVSKLVPEGYSARSLIDLLKGNGYRLILATNPIFPLVGVESRLKWIGLNLDDFELVTSYENCSTSKPNLDYYRDILEKIDADPKRCLMVGNSIAEDMCTQSLGMSVYLVTGFVENQGEGDISRFRSGTIADFEKLCRENGLQTYSN